MKLNQEARSALTAYLRRMKEAGYDLTADEAVSRLVLVGARRSEHRYRYSQGTTDKRRPAPGRDRKKGARHNSGAPK